MNVEEMKELIRILDESSLREIHYSHEGTTLFLSKNKHASYSLAQGMQTLETTAETPLPTTFEPTTQVEEQVASEPEGIIVRSPIVGVVYLSPSPEESEYTTVGSEVTSGQVLCLVEAMKIMNEIKSDTAGKIVEIFVENEQVVEYNQPLFRIV